MESSWWALETNRRMWLRDVRFGAMGVIVLGT